MTPQSGDGIARADAIVTFTAPRPAHVFGNLTRGPDSRRAHRLASRGDRLQPESGGHDPARFCGAARAASPRQQQRHVRARADRRRLVRQVGSRGHGRHGCAARGRGTEHGGDSSARADQRRRVRRRTDDRASGGDRGRLDLHWLLPRAAASPISTKPMTVVAIGPGIGRASRDGAVRARSGAPDQGSAGRSTPTD